MATTEKPKFTQAFLDSLIPGEKLYEKRDAKTKGMIVRVRPNGRKIFVFEWARGKRVDIGDYPTVTLALARAECGRILARIAAGDNPRPEWRRPAEPRPDKGMTVAELYDPYAEHYGRLKVRQGFSPNGLMSLQSVVSEVGDKYAAALDVRKWRDGLLHKNTIKTANRKLAALRSLYQWAVENKHLDHNTAAAVKLLKEGNVESRPIRALDKGQEAALRTALENRTDYLKPLWLIGVNTGLRRGELLRVSWADFTEDGRLHVRKSKTGKSRYVKLNKEARRTLHDWRFVRPVDPVFPVGDFKKAWNTVRAEIDLPLTWNECTRHTFATRLLTNGATPHVVQRLLGHTTTRMQEVYGHLLPDDAADAVELVSA